MITQQEYFALREQLDILWKATGCHGYDAGGPWPHPDCGCQCGQAFDESKAEAALDEMRRILAP